MDYKLVSFMVLALALRATCKNLDVPENGTAPSDLTEGSLRKGRSQSNLLYVSLISCAVNSDAGCFVDEAGKLLEVKKNELLAQADLEALQATGRADPEHTPSQVAKTIEHLISQISEVFKNGLFSFFNSREGDDEDVLEADDKDDGSAREVDAEGRGKKKKKQQNYLKHVVICAVIGAKLTLLASLLQTALLLKLALLGIGILGVNVAKLVVMLKHGKPKTIYYENSHHDHHYEHDDVWHDDHHWGRSFPQDLAYAGQRSWPSS